MAISTYWIYGIFRRVRYILLSGLRVACRNISIPASDLCADGICGYFPFHISSVYRLACFSDYQTRIYEAALQTANLIS